MKINVTGATGNLGRKITEELLKVATDKDIAVTVRNANKAKNLFGEKVEIKVADYQSMDKMTSSFTGTDTLIYIPSIAHPNLVRLEEFENVLSAAEKAKVKQFIFIGFFADHENNPFLLSPFYAYVPRRLASANLDYTLVRNAMYADPLPPYLHELIERGKLPYPAGDGKSILFQEEIWQRPLLKLPSILSGMEKNIL